MAYGRRNFIAYQRGVVGGAPPSSVAAALLPPRQSLTNYRNRAILFFVATCLYTAFLYQSGVCNCVFLVWACN
jgi:hypothetical protein